MSTNEESDVEQCDGDCDSMWCSTRIARANRKDKS